MKRYAPGERRRATGAPAEAKRGSQGSPRSEAWGDRGGKAPRIFRDIPFAKPEFDEAEAQAVADVLRSGWVSQGPAVERFERIFAERVGARHAVATSSCTTALHLALVLAGVGPGDEVICPSYTFIATSNAVLYTGATPVFADIEANTWNIDPTDVVTRLSSRTKAIIAVDQVGLPADIDRLIGLVPKNVSIVEDAACAIGSRYHGRPVGSYGDLVCFSFHPRKTISTGEGGMLTTADSQIAERARGLRSHGASVSAFSRHASKGLVFEEYRELGYNYRMSDVQAAIGIAQMQKLDALLARRRAVAERYSSAFRGLSEVVLPATPAYAEHSYQSYGLMLTPASRISRDDLLRELAARGISCRRGIPPIHLEPLYRDRFPSIVLPVTEAVAARSIFLPMYASLSTADQSRVTEAVTEMLTRSS
ncbi:MAG TPA: DegT/DnrJ/EryC1/StrS family aminotransferase [Vicinamibacterales bacterium]|nr:DegT/DnrJ/EryC1/StrS family aminotransferase [Vicinamibacterales bacterium]